MLSIATFFHRHFKAIHKVVSATLALAIFLQTASGALSATYQSLRPDTSATSNSQSTNLFLPLVFNDYSSNQIQVPVTVAAGGILTAPDGNVITVPAGAFPADGYLLYVPQQPTSAPPNMQATSIGFELRAYTNAGQEITQFDEAITGSIPYDYDDYAGGNEFSLAVYYFDEFSQTWLPVPSEVHYHQSTVVFTTTHFTQFGLMYQPLDPAQCITAQVGRSANPNVPTPPFIVWSLCDAYLKAGGIGAMGVAEPGPSGNVHDWDGGLAQDFVGGTLLAPILFYRPDTTASYYMDRNVVNAYFAAGGPSDFLGFPRSNPRPDGPTWYVDDNNDFRSGPIQYFGYGFIGLDSDDNAYEAHRNFPLIERATWQTYWQSLGTTDPQGNPQYRFVVEGVINEANANPAGRPGDNPDLDAGFWVYPDGGINSPNGIVGLELGETGQVTFSGPYTQTFGYEFYFFVYRTGSDDLSGYYPCNHAYAQPPDSGRFSRWMGTAGPIVYDFDCTSGGGGGPVDLPPQLSLVEVWNEGTGGLSIKAQAIDDVGIASVTLSSTAGNIPNPNMQLWSAPNIYAREILNISPSQYVEFTVTARDTAGHVVSVSSSSRALFSAGFGLGCPNQCYQGNPINTATGNDADVNIDLVVPGRGGTDIVINRSTNSQDPRVGPFGLHSSFDYDMSLMFVDNPLLQGIQARYGDGHTANFTDVGGGRFEPVSLTNFDYIQQDGTDYVLHLTNRMTYRFNSEGRLIAIVNKNGHAITLTYDSTGHLDTITNASNRVVELDWNNGHIVEIRAPEGKVLRYQYDGDLLRFFTDANSGTTEYRYDANQFVNEIISPNGYPQIQQELDDRGRVLWQIEGETARRDFVYDDVTRTTIVTDAHLNEITYIYNEDYLIASVIDARGYPNHATYDERGNLIAMTDRRQNTWLFDHDNNGNVIYQEDPPAPNQFIPYHEDITRWLYNSSNDVISTTNALGDTTLFGYDNNGNLLNIFYPDGAVVTMTYNSYGQPLTFTDGEGNTTIYTYDPITGDQLTMTDGEGNLTTFGFDDLGRQTSVTDDNGHTIFIAYDGNDNITHVTDAKGEATVMEYDLNNNLIDIFDRRDGHTQFIFDESDWLITSIDPEGSQTEYAYNLMGYTAVITNPRGFTTTYAYDPNYNITTVKDEAGNLWRSQYDANNNKLWDIDPQGNQTSYVYDAVNRVRYVYDPLSQKTEYCYDQIDQLIRSFDPRRAMTVYQYDPVTRLDLVVNAEGEPFDLQYDLAGNLRATINGEGEMTQYFYDRANRLTVMINPMNETTTTHYDGVGNVVEVVDPRGYSTWFDYDANNNLTVITDTLGFTTTFAYNDEDLRESVTDSEGSQTLFNYYLDGQLKQITEPGGQTTQYIYDPNKNVIEMINARDFSTHYTYEARDLLVTVTDPLSHTTSYSYNELLQLETVTDAEGNSYGYEYNALDWLIRVTDPMSNVTQYDHDAVGNTTVITYANGTVSAFQYNSINQLRRETDPLGNTWIYGYDDAGRQTMRVDGLWQATYYRYDDAGRLKSIIYGSTGQRVDFTYDANGNRITMQDGNGLSSWGYDVLNRPITATNYLSQTIYYGWNSDGTRASLTYPDGSVLTYTYDIDNRLETLTLPGGETVQYTYNPLHFVTDIIYSNGTHSAYDYDDANRLTSLHNTGPGGTVIANYDFTLDNVGNRTGVLEERVMTPTDPVMTIAREYGYDELYRLVSSTSAISHTHEMNWTFDNVGNWETQIGAPEPTGTVTTTTPISLTYDHNDLNSLIQAGDWQYGFDANGNRILAQAPLTATQYAPLTSTFGVSATLLIHYTYDYENRLTQVEEVISYTVGISGTTAVSPTMVAAYVYDGLGLRTEKWVTTTITATTILTTPMVLHRTYVYDGLDPIAEHEAQNDSAYTWTNYYWGNEHMVALEQLAISGTVELLWFHHDALGSIVALSTISGTLNTVYRYDEYGDIFYGDTRLNHYAYTSQEWDEETGFYHFFARFYDPQIGTWITQDVYRGQTTKPLSLNRYIYVHGNSINFIDKDGYSVDCSRMSHSSCENVYGNNMSPSVSRLESEIEKRQKEWADAGLEPAEDTDLFGPEDAVLLVLQPGNVQIINDMARRYNVPPSLLAAVIAAEMDFDRDQEDVNLDKLGRKGINLYLGTGPGIASVRRDALDGAIDYLDEAYDNPNACTIATFANQYDTAVKNRESFSGSTEGAAMVIKALLDHKGEHVYTSRDQAVVFGAYRTGVTDFLGENSGGYTSQDNYQRNIANGAEALATKYQMGANAYMMEPYIDFFELTFPE